ncbi:MAG: right-handed parallel beta-helix repeat-containing protein [Kiritimatiellae bacterium]|nr:right-handed parallel beta-helix repeat-containing protein [Kiritimatiellia bacterium]MDD5522042.1 right-handed parallel beta-helix repeat-containing protein [Kiritimatiellia bacterium]
MKIQTPMGIVLTMIMIGLIGENPRLIASEEERLADEILHRTGAFESRISGKLDSGRKVESSVVKFRSLVRAGNWIENWPNDKGEIQKREVTGEIWNGAIQAALRETGCAVLPRCDKPYYLNAPIILRSGQMLIADRDAEIRLRPGVNTCMIRNENIVGGQNGPVPKGSRPDIDIAIEGGIWTTLAVARRENNGNNYGRSDGSNTVPCCHGVILLNNTSNTVVRNVVIRQSRPFGIHLSNCTDFLVDGIKFEDHGRDGVHVNGPACFGVIRNITGGTHDDFIALNAWDWRNCTPSFGPIHHVLVENVIGCKSKSPDFTTPYPDGTAEIRLLPGTENFVNGTKLACDISDCVFRKLTDIRTFKVYDQPNLELGRDKDFADPIGEVRNIYFRQLVFNRPGRFQLDVNVNGLAINDVQLCFALPDAFKLVEIGPMSATYKRKPDDPSTWFDIFSPDLDIIVRNFKLTNVTVLQNGQVTPFPEAGKKLVKVADQTLNPDYPKTTPRGGTGKVKFIQ